MVTPTGWQLVSAVWATMHGRVVLMLVGIGLVGAVTASPTLSPALTSGNVDSG